MIDYEEVTQHGQGVESHQEDTTNRQTISIGLSFSLFLRSREGLGITGDMTMQKTATGIPQRASKPVTVDIEQEYDDDSAARMPRSAVRFRSTTQPQPRTTDALPVATTRRVSGNTRLLLWIVLVLGIAFLINGIVVPAITDLANQVRYGTARIVPYDINGRHFLTEEDNGRVRIVVSSADNQHNQVLVTPIGGVPNHSLVTLEQSGTKIEVAVNGTYIAVLVPDGNGYKWGSN